MVGEFNLIHRFFSKSSNRKDVITSIGDDGAIVSVPFGHELVLVMDTLVDGVHFPRDTDPYSIGCKAIAVNLSDLAAMGAEPAWAMLALTLPQADESWLSEFARGLFAATSEYNVTLIGGDTTRGPLTITIQLHGFIPTGRALRRSGAKIGDDIYVTGTLGDAGLALQIKLRNRAVPLCNGEFLSKRLAEPTARVLEGIWLRNVAHAAIDISDGLLADLNHILLASDVGARLDITKVPVSSAYQMEKDKWLKDDAFMISILDELPLSAGDDYELCFTAPSQAHNIIMEKFKEFEVGISCIGKIEENPGIRCHRGNEKLYQPAQVGFQHF